MYSHHTKSKGDAGLGFVIADMLSSGVQVALPISEHLPFDCIAVSPRGELSRVSVKYRKVDGGGVVTVPLRSVWSNSSGCHVKKYDKSEFDAVVIYCPDTGKCYYVRIGEIGDRVNLILRVTAPKQEQKTMVYARDFEGAMRLFG